MKFKYTYRWFSDNNFISDIPFNRLKDVGNKVGIKLCNKVGDKVGDKVGNKLNSAALNFSQIKVLAEIRNNPNITKSQLMVKCNLGKT